MAFARGTTARNPLRSLLKGAQIMYRHQSRARRVVLECGIPGKEV